MVFPRAASAVAGDVDHHELRVPGPQRFRVEPEALDDARCGVVQEDVSTSDQLASHPSATGRLQVDRQGFLAAV